MPAYNSAGTIKQSIDSVLSQTFTDWELLAVNDQSTDETAAIMAAYAHSDERIKLVEQGSRQGVVAACNLGIKEAGGEFFARLDSDDIWVDKTKLEQQVRFLDEHKDYVLVGTGAVAGSLPSESDYYFRHPVTDIEIRKRLLSRNRFVSSSIMARMASIKELGGYSLEDKLAEDYGLILRLGSKGQIANLPGIMVWYRTNPLGLSQARNLEQVRSAFEVVQKFRRDYPGYFRASLKWRLQLLLSRTFGVRPFNVLKKIVYH
jgi:glycosyltransferase involved in cell wall biosynthesis